MDSNRYLPLAGRLLVGLPFILFGVGKATTYAPTVGMIEAVGLPLPPLAFLAAVTLEIVGGALLIVGYKVRPVAAFLSVFSVLTAVYFHGNLADQNSFVHFFKNVMLAGGLLQVAAFGVGALSLDAYLASRRTFPAGLAAAH
jgi:putative oxidoreductase